MSCQHMIAKICASCASYLQNTFQPWRNSTPFIVCSGSWQVQQYLICQGMWPSLLFQNYGAAWKSHSCMKTICWSCVTLPLRARATCVSHSSLDVWSLCKTQVLFSHDTAVLHSLHWVMTRSVTWLANLSASLSVANPSELQGSAIVLLNSGIPQ